jgi:hypothetical protein
MRNMTTLLLLCTYLLFVVTEVNASAIVVAH